MAFKMKGSPHKMGGIQGTASALKQVTAKTTDADGKTTEYPTLRNLGDDKYKSVLNSLPGNVFKDGKNTGDVFDVNADAYSKYLKAVKPGGYTK
jgi:hypothetical protein